MHDPFKWVGDSEVVSKPNTTFGVGIGIGIGFYAHHGKQELINFDPDTDPDSDSDVGCVSYVNELHRDLKYIYVALSSQRPSYWLSAKSF